jgi:hypothetical protein
MKSMMCSPQSLVSAITSTLSACGSCLRHFQPKRHVVQSGKTSQDFVDLADRGSELDNRCKDKQRATFLVEEVTGCTAQQQELQETCLMLQDYMEVTSKVRINE